MNVDSTLVRYYDRNIDPEIAEQATAPTTVNFIFYKQKANHTFKTQYNQNVTALEFTQLPNTLGNNLETIEYNNYGKNGLKGEIAADQVVPFADDIGVRTYIANLDFGDNTKNDELQFRDFPKHLQPATTITHTYTKPGVYEMTGVMMDCAVVNEQVVGYVKYKKFTIRFNLLENPEGDYDYITINKPSVIIGGASEYSVYNKSLKLLTGYTENDVTSTPVPLLFQYDRFSAYRAAASLNQKYYVASELDHWIQQITSGSGVISSLGGNGGEYELANTGPLNNVSNEIIINNGLFDEINNLGDHLGDTDIGQIRAFKKPMRMWNQLGFPSEIISSSATPSNYLYWKNYIPKNYNVTVNRQGVETVYDATINKNVIQVDTTSNQNWEGGFAYPVIPKLNEQAKLDADLGFPTGSDFPSTHFYGGKTGWNLDDNNAYATTEYITEPTLIINTDLSLIDEGELYDVSGNDLQTKVLADYKININAAERTVNRTSNFLTPTKGREDRQF